MVANSDMAAHTCMDRSDLMALINQLEQQLHQADQQRRWLLEAMLAEALVGRLSEEEECHADIA